MRRGSGLGPTYTQEKREKTATRGLAVVTERLNSEVHPSHMPVSSTVSHIHVSCSRNPFSIFGRCVAVLRQGLMYPRLALVHATAEDDDDTTGLPIFLPSSNRWQV